MKRICVSPHVPGLFILFFLFSSCGDAGNRSPAKSENSLDAARNFIRAALDGKFREARSYMLEDSVNTNYMDVVERAWQNSSPGDRDGYRTATIRFFPVSKVNDSTTIIIYANSFKNDKDTLRVVRVNDLWLVDLKYLYQHDRDTINSYPIPVKPLP